jgi:Tol biopolymer transport system component
MHQRPLLSLWTILTFIFVTGCSSEKQRPIDYVGQEPPGLTARMFAPGLVSSNLNEHSALAFSPDGTSLLWAVMDADYRGRIFEMKFAHGSWSKPTNPSFADTTTDHYAPSFSPDGKTLFFSSRRPTPSGYRKGRGNRIWMVPKIGNKWGDPNPIDTTVSKAEEFSHTVSSEATIYFSSPDGKNMNIYKAEFANDKYSTPTSLPAGINTEGYEDGPFIAPDESYLIFESTRPEGIEGSHDLYITFKNKNGEWGKVVNMGPTINSAAMERFPRVSPDGKYLFFASNRDQSNGKIGFDFYWVDAKIIEQLRGEN